MDKIVVKGGKRLNGEIKIHGAKNAALPILCASLLCDEKVVLHNCPELSDVENTLEILRYFGCKTFRDESNVEIVPSTENKAEIPADLMSKMRSSIIFLGAMLSKNSCAKLCFPGGCELGPRPIDIHLNCLRKLGVEIEEKFGMINCFVSGDINGESLNLPFPSVGATENIILATVLAKGSTTIHNAAREPEIADLCVFLNKCGANIIGAGDSTLIINGVEKLSGCEHTIVPDRIETSTYMSFAAVTGGKIKIKNICSSHIEPVISAYREAGCDMVISDSEMLITAPNRVNRIKNVTTLVYPGFPTDSGMPLITMCAVANGTSVFKETIFQNRFKATNELNKMGANIKIYDRIAIIEGVENLYGADVSATDLRGGAALIAAGLCAKGTTRIFEPCHIDRGYENIEKNLSRLGADILRS